jgi:hypothetical protein
MVLIEVGIMEYQRYSQYTKDYTNVIVDPSWYEPITGDHVLWLKNHQGGMYHIHRNGTAVKFERKEDAEWFILRWM